jgi:Domain of unknown function (DUF222)/HNH endonuclease
VSALAGSSAGAFARAADGVRLQAGSASADGPSLAVPLSQDGGCAPAPSSALVPSSVPAPLPPEAAPESAGRDTGPRDAAEALRSLTAALEFLAHDDPAGWPEGLQADCLRALAVAESRQAAAHARVLAVFSRPGGGLAGDGHRSPRVWLCWQTAATRRAALGRVSWMRRLGEHPAIAAALADGSVSLSWAGQIAEWTGRLPGPVRGSADEELLAAAAHGAGLADLAFLAEDLRRQHARPDTDDDGFEDRQVRLSATLDGAGRLTGDLTPRCAAAMEAVLDCLARPSGPEDTRTLAQRWHDALEEACIRLIGADMLPQRAGHPVRLDLDITLPELLANTEGVACDAVVQPVITGTADYGLLARLADPASGWKQQLQQAAADRAAAAPYGDVLAEAVRLLSGPTGRAAWLRRQATGIPVSTISLPLDVPSAFATIPLHLRKAVKKRDRHCRFPGCDMPPAGCEVHHIIPRKDGGWHSLTNLILLCRFHHLIAIHRWGWVFTLMGVNGSAWAGSSRAGDSVPVAIGG